MFLRPFLFLILLRVVCQRFNLFLTNMSSVSFEIHLSCMSLMQKKLNKTKVKQKHKKKNTKKTQKNLQICLAYIKKDNNDKANFVGLVLIAQWSSLIKWI